MSDYLTGLANATYVFVDRQVLPELSWPELQMVFKWYKAQMRAEKQPHYGELLPLLTCDATGGNAIDAVPLAAAWMFYNLASDLFDDLMDQDSKERPWNEWPSDRAMQVGLGLVAAAQFSLARIQAVPETKSAILEAYAGTLAVAAREQRYDGEQQTIAAYFQHILGKTGLVLATVAWSGAKLHCQDERVLEAMHQYGLAIGVMTQLLDDLRDLQNNEIRSDLAISPYTLPVIYARSQIDHPSQDYLCELLHSDLEDPVVVNRVCEILADIGAVSYAVSVVRAYEEKAHDALCVLPEGNRSHLSDYATSFLRHIPTRQ